MESEDRQHFEFRGFRLDRRKRSLVAPSGAALSLNAKAFDTLVYFLDHPGQVLDRATLLDAVWPTTVVEENNLSQAVAALRRLLGDGFIVTVTGRGYQFVADVQVLADPIERARPRWRVVASSGLALSVAGAVFVALAPNATIGTADVSPPPDPRSIAVLPFQNESAAEENAEFFANGIHEELLTRLAKIRALKVTSRTSVEAYRDSSKSLPEIGRQLGVAALVEGRVQRASDRVRITVQLVDAARDEHLWAQSYDRELSAENVFTIQRDIAISIADTLEAELSPREISLLEDVPTTSTRAYDFFLTGVNYFRTRTDPQNFIPLAMRSLERAVEEDPEFASGWAMLSVLHSEMYWFYVDRSHERLELAERAARRARDLAPELPEVRLAMAMYHYRSARDYEAALEELEVAGKQCPDCVEILGVRGSVNRRRGDFERSLEDFDRVLERDPRNVFQLSSHHLINYKFLRDYRRASDTIERILELAPDDASARHEQALVAMLRDGDPTLLNEYSRNPPTPDYFADPSVPIDLWRAAMYERDYARAVTEIGRIEVPHPLLLPGLYAGLAHALGGQQELAVAELNGARADVERRVDSSAGDPAAEAHYRALHGYVLAALGERDEAIREAHRARSLLPKTKDALDGAWIQYVTIHVFALAGAEATALDELDDYLSGHGPWSIEGMLPDPVLDPIREHPRFADLVERHRR